MQPSGPEEKTNTASQPPAAEEGGVTAAEPEQNLELTRDIVDATVRQMYPRSNTIWSKVSKKAWQLLIVFPGDKDPNALSPIRISGTLLQIARTLVTAFAMCQQVVFRNVQAEMAKGENSSKKEGVVSCTQE